MKKQLKKVFLFFIITFLFGVIACKSWYSKTNKISFNTEIRPILNAKCTGCHGGVKKAGGLSFIYRDLALGKGESGKTCIIPGDPENSEFIKRLTHHDIELKMPLGKEPLNEKDIDLLKTWIKQGANWEEHWAYIAPKPQEIPDISDSWIKNPIDNFVLAKLDDQNIDLKPSKETIREVLLRRLSLDLIGLPPTEQELEDFLKDNTESAYEKQVDRLLASSKYGEKWTAMWLELARFADTKGYEKDSHRNIWRFRDYVINAYNNDMPYDQFLVEQLAGDMLPNPTENQYIATAFHRNTMNNDEGGTDDEEFRTADVIDRLNTTFDVTQGITMSCVQCHSHPYDPIEHKEYYQMLSFLNNTEDANKMDEIPNYIAKSDTPTVRIKELMTMIDQITETENKNETYSQKKNRHALPRLEAENCNAYKNVRISFPYLYVEKPNSYVKYSSVSFDNVYELKIRHTSAGGSLVTVYLDGLGGKKVGEFELAENFGEFYSAGIGIADIKGKHDLYLKFTKNKNGFCNSTLDFLTLSKYEKYVHTTPNVKAYQFNKSYYMNFGMEGLHSWKPGSWVMYENLDLSKAKKITFKYTVSGGSTIEFRKGSSTGELIGKTTISDTKLEWKTKEVAIKPIQGKTDIYVVFQNDANGNHDGMISEFIFEGNSKNAKILSERQNLEKYTKELQGYLYAQGTPFMRELKGNNRRITQVFNRGNWRAKTDTVHEVVPKIMHPLPKDAPKNRLGMAQWLVSKENPLTARVAVNRLWEQLFGLGIVETLEDFGSQGIKPTHPELLDYLAIKFMNDFKWSNRKMLKFMVMSATYRQSSEVQPEHLKLDPRNRYLARAPRVRLSSEQVRDQALAVSGLLSPKMYGPSVMPYQPDGIWQSVYNGASWTTSEGEDKYRRAVYTYMKRTSPFPNQLTFDGSSREVCLVRRIKTNTPLQALAMLNDTTFSEVSQALAQKMMAIKNTDIKAKINAGYKLALANEPNPKATERLMKLYQTANQFYTKNKLKQLHFPSNNKQNTEYSALSVVASAIINLDEFITKE